MYEALALASAAVLILHTVLAVIPLPKIVTPVLFLWAGVAVYIWLEDTILAAGTAGFANMINVLLTRLGKTNDTDVANLRRTLSDSRIPRL